MVRVQSSDAFDRGDEFWIILKREPALIDRAATGALITIDPSAASIVRGLSPSFRIGSLGVKARVFIF